MKLIDKILAFIDRTDEYLLEQFQKFSDKVQINVGIPCTGMARMTLLLFFIASVIMTIVLSKEHEWESLILETFFILWYYHKMEKGIKENEESSSNRIFKSSNAIEYAYFRQTLLVLLVILMPILPLLAPFVGPFFRHLFPPKPIDFSKPENRFMHRTLIFMFEFRFWLLLACAYFLSCTPRTPGESRLGKYIRAKIGVKTQSA